MTKNVRELRKATDRPAPPTAAPDEPDARRYPIRWNVEAAEGGYTRQQLVSSGWGGCDKLILTSVMDAEDGGASYKSLGFDGGMASDVPPRVYFHIIGHTAKMLAHRDDVPQDVKVAAQQIFELVRGVVMSHHPAKQRKKT